MKVLNRWCCISTHWIIILFFFTVNRFLNDRRSFETNSFTHRRDTGEQITPSWKVTLCYFVVEVHCLDHTGNFCEILSYSKHRLRLLKMMGDFHSCGLITQFLKFLIFRKCEVSFSNSNSARGFWFVLMHLLSNLVPLPSFTQMGNATCPLYGVF